MLARAACRSGSENTTWEEMRYRNSIGFCVAISAMACGGTNPAGTSDPGACTVQGDCESGQCCDNRCENFSVSMRACGGCGNACNDGDYCTGTSCEIMTFGTLCNNGSARVVQRDAKAVDGQPDDPTADNEAAATLGTSLSTMCHGLAPATTTEDAVLQEDKNKGLNTSHGDLLVVAGGSVYSSVIAYLDEADVTPVEMVLGANGAFQLVSRSQRRVLAADNLQNLSATRDYIVGQAIYDSTSGTQILNVYGIFKGGTTAGATYFSKLAGQSQTSGQRWFVAKTEGGTLTRLAGE